MSTVNRQQIRTLMSILSVGYGGTLAVLGATHCGAINVVAVAGALALSVGWTVSTMVGRQRE